MLQLIASFSEKNVISLIAEHTLEEYADTKCSSFYTNKLEHLVTIICGSFISGEEHRKRVKGRGDVNVCVFFLVSEEYLEGAG